MKLKEKNVPHANRMKKESLFRQNIHVIDLI